MISPYDGLKPYIFVSFSHKNLEETLGIVRRLNEDGYRVWYDEGIDPGTEWDENIAAHVENCSFFLALMSTDYLNSSNCRDELNYARDLEKNRVLIYLESVSLPGGMQMRLSRLQAIHKYTYKNEDAFFAKLYKTPEIRICYDESLKAVGPEEKTAETAAAEESGTEPKDSRNKPVPGEDSRPVSTQESRTKEELRKKKQAEAADRNGDSYAERISFEEAREIVKAEKKETRRKRLGPIWMVASWLIMAYMVWWFLLVSVVDGNVVLGIFYMVAVILVCPASTWFLRIAGCRENGLWLKHKVVILYLIVLQIGTYGYFAMIA